MGAPEAAVENYLRKEVEKAGGMCVKFSRTKDMPDRVVILDGMVVFVEVKAPEGKVSPGQTRMFNELVAKGAMVFVLESKFMVDDFMEFMTQDFEEEEAPAIFDPNGRVLN